VSTKVSEVLKAREGVCQDFARLAIACLRANGLAASYVSGYLATDPPPGKQRMLGVDATHAWAAVRSPDNHWLQFDPTNDQLVDERYVTVGWGRDYADVPPLRGIIYTDSEYSVIDVSVDVSPFDGPVPNA
jgi:transglutaminase-like putative cysteine protease